MAQFLIQVKYQLGVGQKWSNVWRVEAADLFTAAGAASSFLAPDLVPILDSAAKIVEVLTSTPGTPGAFITEALDLSGTSTSSGVMLPLFNSVKVLFPLLSGGRPDYKYFKGFLTESNSGDGLVESASLSGIATLLGTLITDMDAAGATLVDNGGTNYSVVTPQAAIQMRQMHRKRRRTP